MYYTVSIVKCFRLSRRTLSLLEEVYALYSMCKKRCFTFDELLFFCLESAKYRLLFEECGGDKRSGILP